MLDGLFFFFEKIFALFGVKHNIRMVSSERRGAETYRIAEKLNFFGFSTAGFTASGSADDGWISAMDQRQKTKMRIMWRREMLKGVMLSKDSRVLARSEQGGDFGLCSDQLRQQN